jgi:hypothetical protein
MQGLMPSHRQSAGRGTFVLCLIRAGGFVTTTEDASVVIAADDA